MTLNNGFEVSTVVSAHKLRRQKEELKKEIKEIREKIAQYDIEMSMIQSITNTEYVAKPGEII
jgi:phage shock protein A